MIMVLATTLCMLMLISSASAVVTVSNGIYDVTVQNTGNDIGTYTVATGANNPNPDQNVLYGGADQEPGTSYLTVRDETNDSDGMIEYTSSSDSSITPSPGYTQKDLDDFNPVVTTVSPTQITTEWNVTNENGAPLFNILQSIMIVGTTIQDSMVQVNTAIENVFTGNRTIGMRYLWDIQIADNDGAQIRTIDPQGTWLNTETEWTSPTFGEWEATDDPTSPTFNIFGSNVNPAQASPPGELMVAEWDDAYDAAYGYTIDPTQVINDSAVLYYYLSENFEPGDVDYATVFLFMKPAEPSPTPTPTPTPSENASTVSAKTVPMQTTGSPLGFILVGLATVVGGAIYSRKNT